MRFPIAFAISVAALSAATLPALAEVPAVVTDIPPVHALVSQVMGDLGTPELLLEKGADEHDFQLRPSQMRSISEADLVIWVGPELTPWLDRAMDSSDTISVKLLKSPGTVLQDMPEGHGHGEEAGHADHGSVDPHAWLNPANATVWLQLIAEELARLDPEHADRFRANAAQAQAEIATMDAEIRAMLTPVQDSGMLTYHAAFGYFAQAYGLSHMEALAMGDAAAPGAAAVSEVTEEAQAGAFVCAFPEAQHSADLLEQVVAGTDTKIGGPLDPVGSTLEFGPQAYQALMRGLAGTLAECLTR